MLERYLERRDAACPACDYNLRDLRGQHCPECGESLRLHVALEHPARGAFIVGLVGLSFAGGFSGMVLLWAMILLIGGRGGPEMKDVAVLVGEFLLALLIIRLWCALGRWLRRQPAPLRRSLAAACWVLPVLALLFFAWIAD